MARKSKKQKALIKSWKKPRNAEELFRVIQLFLDDAFGLVGSSSRDEWGGELEIDMKDSNARVFVVDPDRKDRSLWVEIDVDEWNAFEAWRKVGRPATHAPYAPSAN